MGIESEPGFTDENSVLNGQDADIDAKAEAVLLELLDNDSSPARVDNIPTPDETQEAKNCTHHWIVESPVGGISHGCCKNCGRERDFDNIKAIRYPKLGINTIRAEEAKKRREGNKS